jgi:putative Holliday junction resolvase
LNVTRGKILAIDFGSKRIGIALSDATNTIAFGREVVKNDDKYLERITHLVTAENVIEIVLGYPLSLKGNKSAQTIVVEGFEEELRNYLNARLERQVNIVRWDERYTSKMASDSMIRSGMKKKDRRKKENLDIISAALLLQSYLDSLKPPLENVSSRL